MRQSTTTLPIDLTKAETKWLRKLVRRRRVIAAAGQHSVRLDVGNTDESVCVLEANKDDISWPLKGP
jgi:hypothetical protein